LFIDGMGIVLIALASATLEVALDRGQIEDWLSSRFICWMLALALFGWIATVIWEMTAKEPIIDFRLLANRNFAIANALFFVFGVGLFGSTTLIPQLLQSLYGYRAIDAGLVLGPGALVITVLAPVGAQLIQRRIIRPRILVIFSLSIVAAAMWHYSTFTPTTDYRHFVLARAFQGLGYGFFFVPISIIAYSQLRPDQNNRASSLTNFFRNWGGSFGIALITTVAERRQQFHQTNLGSAISDTSQQFAARSHALAD
jgi:MFS transporter, DHA2 family, multidrug resistance protein